MSNQRTSKMAPLLHDVLKRAGAWHQFIGSTEFPKYWLYNEDKTFGTSEKLEIIYDDKGSLKSVTGFNKTAESISFELALDEINKISSGVFKKNGFSELVISEQIVGDTIIANTKYLADSKYDVKTEVTRNSQTPEIFDIKVVLNSKTFIGKIDINSMEIPQIANDIVAELNSLQSNATVAGIENNLYSVLIKEAWIEGSYGCRDWQHTADNVGTILSDLFGVFVTAAYYLVSKFLADWLSSCK